MDIGKHWSEEMVRSLRGIWAVICPLTLRNYKTIREINVLYLLAIGSSLWSAILHGSEIPYGSLSFYSTYVTWSSILIMQVIDAACCDRGLNELSSRQGTRLP
jgi:hypothetical protein